MGQFTKRISEFRGINRSLRPGAIDLSYASYAENLDINAGRLENDIGNYRCIFTETQEKDISIGNPNFLYVGSTDIYLIVRDKYCKLWEGVLPGTGEEHGMFEPKDQIIEDVVNDTDLNIRGVGRSALLANIDNADCLIASGMLATGTGYWTFRDFYVDGADAKTAVYYLSEDTVDGQTVKRVHVRKFGSGTYLRKNMNYLQVNFEDDSSTPITSVIFDINYTELTDKEKNRALTDGIYIFDKTLSGELTDEVVNDAYMWLKVTDIISCNDGIHDGKAEFIVSTTHTGDDLEENAGIGGGYVIYGFIRGECSDIPVTFMTMFYGRLFAAAHRSANDHPRRLYWSCLPGDGRTIEDWTMTDASYDTSGGHVDVGDPSDGYITGLVACGSQLIIFTQTRVWRLYGTAPSNYTLDLIGEFTSPRISSPVEIQGTVYWLSTNGIQYYNGSYIADLDDNGNMKNVLDEFPQYMQEAFMYSTVHSFVFDNSVVFAFDVTAHRTSRGSHYADGVESVDECWLIRYDFGTGNIIEYRVPADRFRQQFVSVLTRNFGVSFGNKVVYETRLIQTIVHKPEYDYTQTPLVLVTPEYMTMAQWHQWNDQEYEWWDGSKPRTFWQTGWTDMQTPEAVKKVQTICLRGSGEFTLTIESEVNKDVIQVKMPDNENVVKDLTPHHAEGRSFRITIESEKPFTIEPYMTLLYEYGGKR